MKKGQILEGFVERMDFPNKGIVTLEDGKRVIIPKSMTGRTLSCSLAVQILCGM